MAHSLEPQPFSHDERLTDDEVQAIVKRYGERQAGGDARPRIADVAEALHVDVATVSQLLREIRGAESERQLRERLDALETENEQLRRRAEAESHDEEALFPAGHWIRRGRRRGRRRRLVLAGMAAVGVGIATSGGGDGYGMAIVAGVILLMLVAFLFRRSVD